MPAKKKGRKRKATKKSAAGVEDDPVMESKKACPTPQKKAATQSAAAKKEASSVKLVSCSFTPPATSSTVESTKATQQHKVVAKKFTPPTAAVDTAVENAKATQERKVVAKKFTPPTAAVDTAAESAKALISLAKGLQKKPTVAKKDMQSATAMSKKEEEMKMKMRQRKFAKKEMPSATATSKKEEELKLKMTLLKKRKVAALAKKVETEKQLATKKKKEAESSSSEAPTPVSSEKLPEGKLKGSTMAEKSLSRAAPTTLSKEPLTPVLEQGESAVSTKEEDTALNEPAPKPMAFGSSVPPTTQPMKFGVPLRSEPDCPKPKFFGASTGGGAAGTPPVFGGSLGGITSPLKTGSGAFLNLQPPGSLSSTPGKFVFGKSANITLTVPSSAPMVAQNNFASFGQTAKFGSSPFGGGGFGGGTPAFGTTSFGGGDASKKKMLGSDGKGEEQETMQSPKEEGEIVDDTENTNEAAVKSTNKDVPKEA